MNAAELYTQLEAKRAEFDQKWNAYPEKQATDGSKARDIPANDIEGIRKLMGEINELGEKYDAAAKSEKEAADLAAFGEKNRQVVKDGQQPTNRTTHGGGSQANQPQQIKTLGELFTESAEFKNRDRMGRTQDFVHRDDDMDVKALINHGLVVSTKTLMTTSANGYPPEVLRNPGVTFSAQRPVQIIDTIPMIPTTQNGLLWMAETVFTNNATETAEGDAAGEAVLTYAEASATVVWIPVFIPVTMQQLDDVPGLRGIIDQRLIFMVRQKLDAQVMGGSGTPPAMKGFRSFSGVQTLAKAAGDTTVDTIRKAINKVNVTGRARANVVYLHSTDKMNIDLIKNANGNYVFTNPLEGGLSRIWGLPMVENEVGSAGTGTVADTNYIALRMRTGVEVAISDSHGEYFIAGKLAIRAGVRAGVEVYRGAAICDMTSL